jgi:hypothetical protein
MSENTEKLKDVLMYLKWGNISKDYFGLSRTWIYAPLNGYDDNGEPCEFSPEQKETLRNALRDIAAKVDAAADNL